MPRAISRLLANARRTGCLILGTLGVLLIFGRLGCPLLEPEEARYAEIPRQMLAAGQWITPLWNGAPYYHKPPLLYWLVMGSYAIFGVHDWSARLVACLASWLTLMIIMCWAHRHGGRDAARGAGLMLCLAGGFIYRAPMLTMDSLLTLWVVLGLWSGHEAATRQNRRWWLLSATASGLGMLTKGPVALVLVAVPLAGFQFYRRSTVRKGNAQARTLRRWLLYLGLACGLAGPWYLAVAILDAGAAGNFFWLHNVQRFLAPIDHAEPCWFYLPDILLALLPGGLMLPWLKRSGLGSNEADAGSGPFVLALLGGVWCVLFFSLSGCKRPGYILPAIPLFALVLARISNFPTHDLARTFAGPRGVRFAISGMIAVELLAVFFVLPAYHDRFAMRDQVAPHLDLATREDATIACYPRGWDSVNFYLDRQDVHVVPGRHRLAQCLNTRRPLLLFVKSTFRSEVHSLLGNHAPHREFWSPGRNVAVIRIDP